MDVSADGEGPVAVAPAAEEIPQPEQRNVRRRLVQSTLFPPKSPETELISEKKLDKNCNGEEYRGDQNKERMQRGKTTPQTRTPKKSKEKSPMNVTPKMNGTSNGKGVSNLVENQGVSPPIPNLRLEAKMAAEENSRMFAGRQIHPFFSSWKVSKRCDETTEVKSNYHLAQRKAKGIDTGPIHVFERDQVQFTCSFSSNFEGFIGLLDMNDFPSSSHPPGISIHRDNASLDQCLCQQEFVCEAPAIVSSTSSDARVGCCRLAEDTQTSDCVDCNSHKQITLYLENRLWTDKYQPKKATEVCGNDESVKLLSNWLHSWQQRGDQACTDTYSGDVCDRQDADYNCVQSESDSENNNEGASLKNVLLISGPTGSGKSAAIYACAKEEGFKVLEVNASDYRNGALVKQRYGEALESHFLHWSQKTQVEPQRNSITKFSSVLPDGKLKQDFYSKMVEVAPMLDEDNSLGATVKFDSNDSTIACGQGQLKHLILFEDVDLAFTEDRGFVAAIQQIAEKAKGPVILTSNCENPVLPANLDRLEVCFVLPSEKELLRLAYMVCSAEKVNVHAHLPKQVVEYCQGDIRKTIMHLQFCRENQRLYGPLMFDPEAGHQVLPKMMPWEFPCQLSELVEKEITTSLAIMVENSVSLEVIKEDFEDKEMQNNIKTHNYGKYSTKTKKEAMLRQNCSDNDRNHCKIPYDAVCDVFKSPGTPVSLTPRKSRRKLNAVMSSDSEDEMVNDRVTLTTGRDINYELILEADGGFPSHFLSTQPSTDMQLFSGAEKLDENHSQYPDIGINLHVKEACMSVDASCVPESTFAPETEIIIEQRLADALEEVSMSNESKQNLFPDETGNIDKYVRDMLGSTCDVIAGLSHEVGDSQNEHVEALTREYQVMDEYSCMDSNKKSKPVEKSRSCMMTDLVRESWRKLCNSRPDLRHFVTSELIDAAGMVDLAYGMSNLISEAELLLSKHQTLDSLESSAVHSEEMDVSSWSDENLQMSSAIAQQGFCFYAKETANLGLKMGLDSKVDFTREMLSTSSMMEVDNLIRQNSSSKSSHSRLSTDMNQPEKGTSSNSPSSLHDHI
ncbi:P-loop containing nucleoside triphosphate hydrolases superfamily [Salix suchowensis]|nr:P-loop containing nucleoside triphosphate hydrolases superfamily [Salix suchowensis]